MKTILIVLTLLTLLTLASCERSSSLDLFTGLSCQDDTLCRSPQTCSDSQAGRRAGHTCGGWPFYQGLYPISALRWDRESEFYRCLARAPGGLYCGRWSMEEYSEGERESGTCQCVAAGGGGTYCAAWDCVGQEVDVCPRGWYSSGSRCCTTDDDGDERCVVREAETERTSCIVGEVVQGVLPNATILLSWSCVEVDNNGPDNAEYEVYTCVDRGDNYCRGYEGHIWGREEFELTACNVKSAIFGNASRSEVPMLWDCNERGLNYHIPNLWFCFLIWLVGGCGFYCVFLALYREWVWKICAGGTLWLLIFYFITLWQGGIYTLVFSSIPITIVWCCADARYFFSGNERGGGSICIRPLTFCCILACFGAREVGNRLCPSPDHPGGRVDDGDIPLDETDPEYEANLSRAWASDVPKPPPTPSYPDDASHMGYTGRSPLPPPTYEDAVVGKI